MKKWLNQQFQEEKKSEWIDNLGSYFSETLIHGDNCLNLGDERPKIDIVKLPCSQA